VKYSQNWNLGNPPVRAMQGASLRLPDESQGSRREKVRKNLVAPRAKMQGAAYGGHPKQATPQRVVDAGQHSSLVLAARENFSVFL
jgi:hypothetical protein